MTDTLTLLKQHALVVGPRFKPGGPPHPQTGWYVYRTWENSADDTFLPEQHPFTQGDTLEEAVANAAEKIASLKTPIAPFDGKLTITGPSDMLGDWWVLERENHDGRNWLESTGPLSGALHSSDRLESGASVEGPAEEWLSIAVALKEGHDRAFRRCAVRWENDLVSITSPRNSTRDAWVTRSAAAHLAAEIGRKLVIDA